MSAMGEGQQPYGWNNQPRGRYPMGKARKDSDEIVYTKGSHMESMPSLSKQLEGLAACVVGLKYVWEYRSPSKTVAPLYHCKLCNVHQFQGHMIAHISGWKHAIRYIIKDHPDKITFTEEDIAKDPTLKKTLKEVSAELESTVGRGQLRVSLKEPSSVEAFKGLLASSLKQPPSKVAPPGSLPVRVGYRTGGFGGYASLEAAPPNYNSEYGHYQDTGYYQEGPDYERYDQAGPSCEYPEYRQRPMNTQELPRQPQGGDLSNTLLGYLDTFKIENESDAQLVLKVTQKLTDILMEYRLRGPPKEPSMPPMYSRRPDFSTPPAKMPRLNEQFSGYKGPPRFPGAPPRF